MNDGKRIDVSTFLDDRKIGFRQWLILILGFITLSVDGFDVTSMGFIAPALIDDWQIARHQLGPIMISSLFGLSFGSMISGPLSDHFGRKKIIICSVAFFGLSSMASAFSWDITSLTVLRFITGLGLGAAMPNITTLVAEYAPKRYRSHMATAIHCGFNTGAALGGLASMELITLFGWRSVLIAGGVLPIVLTLVLLLWLPESVRFLAQWEKKTSYRQKLIRLINQFVPGLADDNSVFVNAELYRGRHQQDPSSKEDTILSLFKQRYRFGTLMIWTTLFIGLFSVYLLSSWLPLMVKDAGLNLTQSILIGAMFQVGGIAGNFCIGLEMDRWGHHKIIVITLCVAAASALMMSLQLPAMMWLICTLVWLLGFCVNGVNPGCYALAAEFYPTCVRATGVCWAMGIGRFGAIAGACAGTIMLAHNWSFTQVFLALPIPLLIGALAIYAKDNHRVMAGSAIHHNGD